MRNPRCFFFLFFLFLSQTTFATTKLDPRLHRMLPQSSVSGKRLETVGEKVKVLIKVRQASDITPIKNLVDQLGGQTGSVFGTILTATVPVKRIPALQGRDEVMYIEASKNLRPLMNVARATVGVDQVQSGTGTNNQSFTGQGVIVGIVDSGIDCLHADFEDGASNSRILFYWDQFIEGNGVSEIENSYGKEYTPASIAAGDCALGSPDYDGHGTHVAGIAAGSDPTYTGVAPNADLIVVKNPLDDQSVLDAIDYIFKKASSLGKPAVVNLSLGAVRNNDGTALFDQAIDSFLVDAEGTEKAGRVIVAAAGNETLDDLSNPDGVFGGLHASVNVTAAAPTGYEFILRDPVLSTCPYCLYMEIWLSAESDCTIEVDAYDLAKTTQKINMTAVEKGDSVDVFDETVDILLDFSDSENALNGKQHAIVSIITLDDIPSFADVVDYSYDLIFRGDCTGDAWINDEPQFASFSVNRASTPSPDSSYTYGAGDSNKTVNCPACATQVIGVGSFMARETWTDEFGTEFSQSEIWGSEEGGISAFSSLGPTADGRTKPDITAPGEPIISTLSSVFAEDTTIELADTTHVKFEGTSMASPFVAGMVALMLQKNPDLTASEVKALLQENASADSFTGDVPNNTWGYGKLNATATVNAETASSSTGGGCNLVR